MSGGEKWPEFNWRDPFLIDHQLSDDERSIQQLTAQYAQQKLLPRVKLAFREEHVEPKILREMGCWERQLKVMAAQASIMSAMA